MLHRAVTVLADYQPREVPALPMMSIDEFMDRWSVPLTDIALICQVDYTTAWRSRSRYAKDGTINRAIWLTLGMVNQKWKQAA